MFAGYNFLSRINSLASSKGCQACQLPSGFVTARERHANRKKDFENDG